MGQCYCFLHLVDSFSLLLFSFRNKNVFLKFILVFADYLSISRCFFSINFKNCWLLPYWKLMNFHPVGRWTLMNIYYKEKYPHFAKKKMAQQHFHLKPVCWKANIVLIEKFGIWTFAAKNPDAQDPAPHFHLEEVHLWWADLNILLLYHLAFSWIFHFFTF